MTKDKGPARCDTGGLQGCFPSLEALGHGIVSLRHEHGLPNPPGTVALNYFAPPCDLADLIGTFYLFTADQPMVNDCTRADFPQLRFMISGAGMYRFGSGHSAPTPEACLLGPTMSATHFDVVGPMQVLGLSLSPIGWYALTRRDASDHADNLLCAATTFGGDFALALMRLRAMTDPVEAIDYIAGLLRPRFRPVRAEHVAFADAADRWLAGAHSPDINALADATGLSPRQLARLANRYFGAPPKLLARKYRALRIASALADGSEDWDAIIGEAFYDQSHFIREMKHFVGFTPHQLLHDPSVIAKLTLLRRAEVGKLSELARIS